MCGWRPRPRGGPACEQEMVTGGQGQRFAAAAVAAGALCLELPVQPWTPTPRLEDESESFTESKLNGFQYFYFLKKK